MKTIIADLRNLAKIPLKFDLSFFAILILLPFSQFLLGGKILGLSSLFILPTLFFFALLHEYGHCWAAHRCGIGVESVKLWALGGLATLDERFHDASPKDEIFIAFAGPLVNFIIAAIAGMMALMWERHLILLYIVAINQILAIFNLIPAFPMDGGRILRGILYHFTGNKNKATRISAQVGILISIGFFILGLATGSFMLMMIFGWIGMICHSILQNKNTIV